MEIIQDKRQSNPFKKYINILKSSPIHYRFAKGSFWSLVGTIVSRAFSMFTVIIIARLLGPENYGVYGMVQSTIMMFGLLAGFAMGGTLTKYIAEFKNTDQKKASRILNLTSTLSLFTAGLMMLLIIIISPWLAEKTLNRPEMTKFLRIGSMYLFFSALAGVKIGAISGFENFKAIAKINSVQAIATPILALPLVYYFAVEGAIVSLVFVAAIGYFFANVLLKKECLANSLNIKYFDRESFKEMPIIFQYSLPSVVSALCVIPAIWISNSILVNQIGGYDDLGLFNAANQWRRFILIIPQILASVSMPILAGTYGKKSKKEFIKAYNINLRLTWSIALPSTVIILILRNPIIALFGENYSHVGPVMTILMITAFMGILSNVIGTTLLSIGHIWTLTLFQLGWGTLLVSLVFILSPNYGGFGMAVAYLLGTFLLMAGQIVYSEVHIAPFFFSNQHYLISATILSLSIISAMAMLQRSSFFVTSLTLIISLVPVIKMMRHYFHTSYAETIKT